MPGHVCKAGNRTPRIIIIIIIIVVPEGVVLLMTRFTSRYGAVSNINEYLGERFYRIF